jgi:hypothetical protein
MFFDSFQNPHQPLLRNNQGIAIHQKKTIHILHILGRKKDIAQDGTVILDPKTLVLIGAAKGTLIMRATESYLQQDAVRLAGRPDASPFIVHAFI